MKVNIIPKNSSYVTVSNNDAFHWPKTEVCLEPCNFHSLSSFFRIHNYNCAAACSNPELTSIIKTKMQA